MAVVFKYLPPDAKAPEHDHVLITPRPKSGGFEVSMCPAAANGADGFDRQFIEGDTIAAVRIAEDWAARGGIDVIYFAK
jgi:hypothetical protein